MSISVLKYQAVDFRTTQEVEADVCACSDKPFCQIVNKNDATQWQIKSSNLITNGTFEGNLNDWDIKDPIAITVTITNESAELECDGELIISASGGTGPYTYSINGIDFQLSDTFNGLCPDCYNVVVKDSNNNLGFAIACIDTNVDCSQYSSPDLYDLSDTYLSKLFNCYLYDLI